MYTPSPLVKPQTTQKIDLERECHSLVMHSSFQHVHTKHISFLIAFTSACLFNWYTLDR